MSRGNSFAGVAITAACLAFTIGCATGPRCADPFNVDCVEGCAADGCTDGACTACGATGACGCCEPRRWSSDWYAVKSSEPIGARQRLRCGKLWPPYPRPTGCRQQFSQTYHAAHYWPHPYNCQDRAYVKQILDTQVANGWVTETTLYDYHFEPDTQLLTHAGFQHLRWILHEAPPERRVAFVQESLDPGATDARVENVRNAASQLVGEDGCPAVVVRRAQPNGTPAEYVDSIQRAIRDSLPEPRIQYQSLPTGTEGGG